MLPKPGLLVWFWFDLLITSVLMAPFRIPYRLLTRPFAKKAPGVIHELDYSNKFAAFYVSSYVVLFVRGKPVRLNLSRLQAIRFARSQFEGETGTVIYFGSRLIGWKPHEKAPPGPARATVFLSYAHEWEHDARWVRDVLVGRGLKVWINEEHLRPGDSLSDRIASEVQSADCLVALLSPEYCTSDWCIREFGHALSSGLRIYPIKVLKGDLDLPPHVRKLLEELGEPLLLDLRGKNAIPELREFAERIAAEAAPEPHSNLDMPEPDPGVENSGDVEGADEISPESKIVVLRPAARVAEAQAVRPPELPGDRLIASEERDDSAASCDASPGGDISIDSNRKEEVTTPAHSPDLEQLIALWPTLPPDARAGIVALASAASHTPAPNLPPEQLGQSADAAQEERDEG